MKKPIIPIMILILILFIFSGCKSQESSDISIVENKENLSIQNSTPILTPATSFGPVLVNVGNAYVENTGIVSVSLQNNLGYTIEINNLTDVSLNQGCGIISGINLPFKMQNGELKLFKFKCDNIKSETSWVEMQIKIVYINQFNQVYGAQFGTINSTIYKASTTK